MESYQLSVSLRGAHELQNGEETMVIVFQDNYYTASLRSVSAVKGSPRTLKPGDYAVVEVPNIACSKNRESFLLGKPPATSSPYDREGIGWDGGHIHYFTMNKFCWLFESQGFRMKKKTWSGFLAKFRNWWTSLLCGDLVIKTRPQKDRQLKEG